MTINKNTPTTTTIVKKTCDLYDVRVDHEWATICLRQWDAPLEGGGTRFGGEILIHSTFGNFSNLWSFCSYPFVEFLAKISRDSFAFKCMGTDAEVYDGDQTFKNLTSKILQERKRTHQGHGALDKEGARELFDRFKESEQVILESSDEMVREVMNMDLGTWGEEAFSEPWKFSENRANPQVVGFWREIWPVFLAQLKAERVAAVARHDQATMMMA